MLEIYGIEVIKCLTTGYTWIEPTMSMRPDFVFVDDQLMGRGGLESLEVLFDEHDFPGKTVFTHDFEGTEGNVMERSAMILGVDACLHKPYRRKSIEVLLHTHS
jgi:DNA-binding NarL/FixJ family response regulator